MGPSFGFGGGLAKRVSRSQGSSRGAGGGRSTSRGDTAGFGGGRRPRAEGSRRLWRPTEEKTGLDPQGVREEGSRPPTADGSARPVTRLRCLGPPQCRWARRPWELTPRAGAGPGAGPETGSVLSNPFPGRSHCRPHRAAAGPRPPPSPLRSGTSFRQVRLALDTGRRGVTLDTGRLRGAGGRARRAESGTGPSSVPPGFSSF